VPLEYYIIRFVELVVAPFHRLSAVWLGVVPLWVLLLLGEMYTGKVSFAHAVRNGFLMVWAGLNWTLHLSNLGLFAYLGAAKERTVLAWIVTACVMGVGVFTIVLGFRQKDRALCEILGHTRFSSYFLIMLYPMQVGLIRWNWSSLAAVLIFALPVWLLIYLAGRLIRGTLK